MLQVHVEFVHCAQEQPRLPNTQCFPQSGRFSFDPSWLVLSDRSQITVVPNENRHIHNKFWTKFLDKLGVKYALFEKLAAKLDGFGLALSNQCFFSKRIARRAKEKGLKIIWSSEMMWHHEGELEAVKAGIIDKVLYASEFQKNHLRVPLRNESSGIE